MDNLSHGRVIGIDVSRDWLDVHCLPDGHRCRVPNTSAGHAAVADLARDRDAVVCFESTGGQEWQLWALLETEGVAARQVPPAQVKAFAQSRGTRAKTDRIDAELIARFFAFRPEAGRSLPAEKLRLLRALTSKRAQLVEMRKRLLAQIRAHQKLGTAAMFEDVDSELKQRIDSLIKEMEDRINRAIASDERLSETAIVLRSIPGIGPVTSAMLIAEMPEIDTITGEEAAALTGLAPVARDSGTLRGKRAIAGGRRALRHVMFQGGTGRGTPQPEPEILCRSPPQSRKTAQGHHYRRRQKAGHHRERPVQEPSEMDRPNGLRDTVAKRTLLGFPAHNTALSISRITLENKGKIRPYPDRENDFAKASGGGRSVDYTLICTVKTLLTGKRTGNLERSEVALTAIPEHINSFAMGYGKFFNPDNREYQTLNQGKVCGHQGRRKPRCQGETFVQGFCGMDAVHAEIQDRVIPRWLTRHEIPPVAQ